jgi:hypothetical protein
MSIDAVALVRIPEWTPPEDLDVRELDDGALVFLDIPFESEPDALLDALDDLIGDAMYQHDDERGIFVLPDAAEPEDAETYEAVLTAVGEAGTWIPLDPIELPPGLGDQNPEALLGQLLEAIGAGDGNELMRAMKDGDQDALKLAQIQMQSAMERLMKPEDPDEGDKKD